MVQETGLEGAQKLANKPKTDDGKAPKPDVGQGHDTREDLAEQNAEVADATNEIAGGT